MRKYKKLLFLILTFAFSTNVVNAASKCDYETLAKLNSESVNVKVNREEKEIILDPSEYSSPDELLGTEEEQTEFKQDVFQVNILNLTENFYVEVRNDINSDRKVFYVTDAVDGVISFDWTDLSNVVNFTIKLYSSSATGCEGEVIRTLYLTLPRYNDYSEYTVCETIPDYYLCQKYVSFEEVDFETFSKNVNNKINNGEDNDEKDDEKSDEKWYTSSFKFIKEHKVAFIIGGITIVVVAGVVTTVVIKNRRRSVI